MQMVRSDQYVFSNLQDLKDAFVKIQVIDFAYFESLFVYLVTFYLLLLVMFILTAPLKRLLKLIVQNLKSMLPQLRDFNRKLQSVFRSFRFASGFSSKFKLFSSFNKAAL